MARRRHRDNLRRFFPTRSAFALRTSAVPKPYLHQFLSYEALTPPKSFRRPPKSFRRPPNYGTDWAQLGEDIDGEDASDQSGASVALSADGTRLAVGAYVNSGVNGDSSGHARVYDVCSTNEPTPTPTRATTTST